MARLRVLQLDVDEGARVGARDAVQPALTDLAAVKNTL